MQDSLYISEYQKIELWTPIYLSVQHEHLKFALKHLSSATACYRKFVYPSVRLSSILYVVHSDGVPRRRRKVCMLHIVALNLVQLSGFAEFLAKFVSIFQQPYTDRRHQNNTKCTHRRKIRVRIDAMDEKSKPL